MTEKRFDVVYEEDDEFENIRYWDIIDKNNNAKTSNELKLCHLLNNLNDENEQLKQRNNRLEEKIQRERRVSAKQHLKWSKEAENKIKELSKREEQLLSEIDDFQDLLSKNDNVYHDRVINLIDDKIAFLYGVKGDLINEDSYRLKQISFAITILRELKEEIE